MVVLLLASLSARAAAPSNNASNMSFSAKSTSSVTVHWYRGDGGKCLLVGKQGATPTMPSDGNDYDFVTFFGFNFPNYVTETDSHCLYEGTGTNSTVTSLQPDTSYTFSIFEFNGTGAGTEFATNGFVETQTVKTLANEPGSPAQSVNFTAVGSTNLTVNWTSGGGSSRIVVMKADSAVGWTPTDGTNYTANTNFTSAADQGDGNKVVYNGSGSSQIITGLSADTTYYVKVFEFSGSGGSENYRTGDPPSGSQKTIADEPSTAPGNPVFSSVGQNSMTLDWTDGDGSYALVVARLNDTPADPSDGSNYTANASFGSGDETASGSYVVYSGSGTNVTVNNLSADSSYTFHVYEFNGSSGSQNYLTDSKGSGTEKTIATEPATAASSVTFSGVGTTNMTTSWTSGSGSKRIVVMRAGGAVGWTPTDGSNYTANADFSAAADQGSGNKVVFDDSTNTVDIIGLTPNTTYHVKVFEYNGSGGSQNYRTDGAPVGDQATASTEPLTNTSAIVFSSVGETGMTVEWTRGDGSNVLVVAKAGSAPTDPTDSSSYTANATFGSGDTTDTGCYVVYSGTNTSVAVVNLSADTTYYFRAYEFNGSGGSENYKTDDEPGGSQTTLAAQPTEAASGLSFSGVGVDGMTVEWTRGNGANVLIVAKAGSAPTDPTDGSNYTANATFGSGDTTDTDCYVVYSGSGTSVAVDGLSANTTYYFRAYEYNGSGGSENYRTSDEPGGSRSTLATEPSTAASSITFSDIGITNLTTSWTNGDGAGRIVVMRSGSAVSWSPTDGSSYGANSDFSSATDRGDGNKVVFNGSTNTVDVIGLSAKTTYHVKVFEYNGSGATLNYKTDSAPTNSQLTESYEPTTNASDLAFSNIDTDQITLTWTRGNGENVLVVGKDGSAPTAPTDGQEYEAYNNFGFPDPAYQTEAGSYVLYKGTGTTVQVNNLTADHTYYFSVYEYSGPGSDVDYKTDDPATDSVKSLASEPGTAASSVSFSNVGTTSLTTSWTSGSGANRIVVMRSGSAVSWTPTDGTNYTANTNFTSAADQGSGNKVVYNGSGTNQIVTGLSPDTTYHVKVFEFNGSGGSENYRADGAPSGNQTTSASEPTVAPGNPVFSNVGQTSMRLDWTAGNGSDTLVVARQGDTPSDPSDATTYSASSDFGSGDQTAAGSYVVYNGSGTNVTVNNLSADSSYTFHVYTFNGSGGSENYLTTSKGTGTQTTLATEPGTAAQNVNFTAIGMTNMTVNWTSGSGAGRIVVMRADNAVNWAPTDGTTYSADTNFTSAADQGNGNKVVYSGSSSNQIVMGLTSNTTYHVKVFEFNGSGGSENYRTGDPPSGSQTTTVDEPTTAPGNPTFSSVSQTSMALTWTRGDGEYVLVVARQGDTPADPTDATTYTADSSFGFGDQTAAGSYVVYRGSGTSVTVDSLSADTSYTFHVYEFNGAGGPENYLTSSMGSGTRKTLATDPTNPTSVTVPTPKVGTEVNIWWSGGSADGFIVLVKDGSAVDDTPVDGTTYSDNSVFGSGDEIGTGNYVCYVGSGTNFVLTGVTQGHTYHVAVFGYNGSGGSENYDETGPAVNDFRPTAVVLVNFGVGMENGQGVVRWETSSELGTIAFNLERLVGDEWTRINAAPVPAKGWQQGGNGAAYAVVDDGVVEGMRYTYRLIEITGEGEDIHGPFERVVQQQLRFEKGIVVTEDGVQLRWLSRAGDTYRIMTADDLVGGQWTPLVTGIAPTPPENVYVVDPAGARTVFYRVELEQ